LKSQLPSLYRTGKDHSRNKKTKQTIPSVHLTKQTKISPVSYRMRTWYQRFWNLF